jgi:hypothetical protein
MGGKGQPPRMTTLLRMGGLHPETVHDRGVDPRGCHLCSTIDPLEDREKVTYYRTAFAGGMRLARPVT